MAHFQFDVEVDEVDPIVGRLLRGDAVVDFAGWLDFMRAVSDVVHMVGEQADDVTK